jgi:uncharacterized protein (TIGR02246 family)
MRARTIIIVAVLLLSSCHRGFGRHERAANAERTVRAAETAWLSDWASHDPKRVVARYSPDAHVNYSGTAFWIGPAEILKGLTPYFADPSFALDFHADRVRVSKSGDLVTTGGSYHVRYTDPSSHQLKQEDGHYVAVWQKQPDGGWKVAEDITAVQPPPGT